MAGEQAVDSAVRLEAGEGDEGDAVVIGCSPEMRGLALMAESWASHHHPWTRKSREEIEVELFSTVMLFERWKSCPS